MSETMADIGKVINGLRCIKGDLILCVDCAYSDGNGHGTYSCKAFCANDAIALLKEQEDDYKNILSDYEDLAREHEKLLNKKIPLITDGQEVIRCKDCKHYWEGYCNRGTDFRPVTCDWFCADGERRTDDA